VNITTIGLVAKAGANCVVAEAIFLAEDPHAMISEIRRCVEDELIQFVKKIKTIQ
jgi:pentose-5-phosphate-3-epimerase